MPALLEEMPPLYLNKIEEVTKSVAEVSMQAAADVLHEEDDHTPSAVPGCIDIPVRFDSSWKFVNYTPTTNWDLDLRFLLSQRKFSIMSF